MVCVTNRYQLHIIVANREVDAAYKLRYYFAVAVPYKAEWQIEIGKKENEFR